MEQNNTPARESNNWCEVAGQKCYMNYCDENGCQDRVRNYTPFGLSLLNDFDLLAHASKLEPGSDQHYDAIQEIAQRGLTAESVVLPSQPSC